MLQGVSRPIKRAKHDTGHTTNSVPVNSHSTEEDRINGTQTQTKVSGGGGEGGQTGLASIKRKRSSESPEVDVQTKSPLKRPRKDDTTVGNNLHPRHHPQSSVHAPVNHTDWIDLEKKLAAEIATSKVSTKIRKRRYDDDDDGTTSADQVARVKRKKRAHSREQSETPEMEPASIDWKAYERKLAREIAADCEATMKQQQQQQHCIGTKRKIHDDNETQVDSPRTKKPRLGVAMLLEARNDEASAPCI